MRAGPKVANDSFGSSEVPNESFATLRVTAIGGAS